jgi:hypothetical protein
MRNTTVPASCLNVVEIPFLFSTSHEINLNITNMGIKYSAKPSHTVRSALIKIHGISLSSSQHAQPEPLPARADPGRGTDGISQITRIVPQTDDGCFNI